MDQIQAVELLIQSQAEQIVNVPHNAFSYENIVYTLRQNLKT